MFVRAAVSLSFILGLAWSLPAHATPIPGSVLWFDASDVDGDGNPGNNPLAGASVGTWVDKASGVQGAQDAINGIGAQQPTYVTNMQNGMAALNFNGAQILATNSAVTMGTFSYFTVSKSTGASLVIAERGANINNGGVFGEFLTATTGDTFRVKRTGGDSGKNYVANWANNNTVISASWLFGGTNASQRLLVDGTQVALTGGADAGVTSVSDTLYIGARSGPAVAFIGNIAEMIVYNSALNAASVNITNNYLSAKYNTPLTVAINKYSGDDGGNGNYDFDVFGIGSESDGTVSNGSYGTGLTLTEASASLGVGDYVLAGHDNTSTPSNLVMTDLVGSGSKTRLERIWYVDKTGLVDATITFNLDDLGLTADPFDNYKLLYRTGVAGNFSDVGLLSSVSGDDVSFLVPNANLNDGFYTLGITAAVPEPSTLLLLGLGGVVVTMARRRRSRISPAA